MIGPLLLGTARPGSVQRPEPRRDRWVTINDEIESALELVGRIDAVPKILGAVSHITGMGLVLVTRITDARWIVCEVLDANDTGFRPGDTVDLQKMICADVEDARRPVIIDDVAENACYADHPVRQETDFLSFLSFPIILKDGTVFGTLCAFDPAPRTLSGTPMVETLGFFADLISAQIDDAAHLSDTRRILRDEKAAAELREQFIAVLGHDLRNPVAAITSGTRMLLQMPLSDHATTITTLIQGSAVRMNGLIDNLLDFARGRLGDGIVLSRGAEIPLRPVLLQVIDELRTTAAHQIDADLDFEDPVDCDAERIGQLASNLIGNAIHHGAVETPVRVRAWHEDDTFRLSVINGGDPIPEDALSVLFQPFARGHQDHREGLGLGLYIAAEIARGHGGQITCVSNAEETRFTLEMPA